MEELVKYIVGEGIVMVPVLYIIGEIVKEAEMFNPRFLPLALLLISMTLTPLLMGGYSAHNVVQAILVTGASVLYYETKKESIQGGDK